MIIVTRVTHNPTWITPLSVKTSSIIAYGDGYIALSGGQEYKVQETMLEICNMINMELGTVDPAVIQVDKCQGWHYTIHT